MVILGIDPGSLVTGFGVVSLDDNDCEYLASGSIKVVGATIGQRLRKVFDDLEKVVNQHAPDEVAIEQVFMHANPGAALKLGQARGAAIVAASTGKAVIAEYSARQVKQAVVGYGNAEKTQVQQMVKLLLKLSGKLQADEADALAVAICHAHSIKYARLLKNKR
jgi:crossover junction endodeoxyribonuclease RuvC